MNFLTKGLNLELWAYVVGSFRFKLPFCFVYFLDENYQNMSSPFTPDTNKLQFFTTLLCSVVGTSRPENQKDLGSSPSSSTNYFCEGRHHFLLIHHLQNTGARLRWSQSYPPPHKFIRVTILVPNLLAVIRLQLYGYFKHEEKTKKKKYKRDVSPLGT